MDTNDSGQSFADLFGQTEVVETKMEPGQKVAARVVSFGKDWIFLDLGGKSEGSIAKNEFVDEEGNVTVQEGDSVEVYFLSVKNNEKLFTLRVSGAAAQAHLEGAYRNGIPVEGTIDKENKGGFEVKIGGNVRAFCPYSLLEMRRITNAEDYIGQTYSFKITKFTENGRNIVVSRRAILEEERAELKEKLQESLKVGDTVNGVITNIRDFGAFVDIGGVEGLIPVSEIAWGHVEDINERIAEGQQVSVTALNLDWENDRCSFSLKEALPDPWEDVLGKFPEGSTHTGKVARLTDFGAFVTLAPGIDGLAHISKLGAGRRINHPREVVQKGDVIEVRIDSVDVDQKRLSLSVPGKGDDKAASSGESPAATEGDYKQYVASKTKEKSLGTLGDLLKAKFEKN